MANELGAAQSGKYIPLRYLGAARRTADKIGYD